MKLKGIATAGIVAAMAVAPATRVQADAGDAIAGALIGGIIGHAIAKDQQRKSSRTYSKSTKRSSGISASQRELNREVQVALNYFGYPAGTPDGAIGPRSRAAISQYQATLGYPPTGQLTEYERTVLTAAYHRAVAGGPMTAQTIASHPMGVRGLLLQQRDEMAGIPPTTVQPGIMATGAAPMMGGALAGGAAATLPSFVEPEVATAPEPALPSFMGGSSVQVSLASHCNKVSLLTNSNGGYTSVASMSDPAFALSEQFCLARTYAMAQGEELTAQVAGFTPAQIAEQCQGFVPALKDHVAAVSLKARDEVLKDVQGFILASGMSPAQLSGTAKICLGVGYTTDNMDLAVGSALLLTAMGEKPYAELIGHHLSQGFGAAQRPDEAILWYDSALEAMQAGQAVFAPGLLDRQDLIKRAAYSMGGRADLLAPLPQATPVPASLPAFQVAPEPASPAALPTAAAPATVTAGATERTGVDALPLAARLPFLLFKQ